MNLDILTKELIKLIEKLRFAGYNIGVTQYIAAQDLILTLAAQGNLPSELTELREFLAPILCHSPKEQAEFDTHFNQWLSQFYQTKIVARFETKTLPKTQVILQTKTTIKTKEANLLTDVKSEPETQISPEIKTASKTETKPLNDLESELRAIQKGNIVWKWVFYTFRGDVSHFYKLDFLLQT